MRIGITCYPAHGGSGVVATELGLALAGDGHSVHFIAYTAPFRFGVYQDNVYFHEVSIIDYPVFHHQPATLSLAAKMAEVSQREHLDLLHVHYAVPYSICAHLAQEMLGGRIKTITTLHGTDITLVGADPSLREITRFAITSSDAVTAVSEYLRRRTLTEFDLDIPIEVIPNFVDTARLKPLGRCGRSCRDHFARPEEKIVMHISNFRSLKRCLDVVRVFAQVRRVVPAKLLLIGSGPELSLVKAEADRLAVMDSTWILGRQEAIENLLPLADVLLLTSQMESFSLVTLEAMSCAVPTVTTDVGGLKDVVLDGETGFLDPVGDIEALSSHVLRILKDEDLAHTLGLAGRRRAQQLFEQSQIVPRYLSLYEKVLAG
ncbi:MAG: N-acetyl-alpha-D-glucosaminyl L-malate synthase BshA [Actinobacteria bacterium]|nr:N-acetyl-alpha-D-glucosaminyl L-malate synthase BshA [Actinomycetota bacterium]